MKSILSFLLVLAAATVCDAGFVINLGGGETSGSGAGAMADDAVVLTFENSAVDAVKLTITARAIVAPEYAWNKAKEFYFNSSVAITSFAYDSGVAWASAAYSAGGIGGFGSSLKFNNKVSFSTSGPSGAFYPGKSSSYILTGLGLTESSFNSTSVGAGGLTLLAGMHINDPDDGANSGKYGNTEIPDPSINVPEPMSAALWSIALCVGFFCRARRRISAAGC